MASGKPIAHIPANESIFLNEALVNEDFRNALINKDRNKISQELDRLGVTFNTEQEKQAALDAIDLINWRSLKDLEDLLGRRGIIPTMN